MGFIFEFSVVKQYVKERVISSLPMCRISSYNSNPKRLFFFYYKGNL